jgi:DNA/RNA-binding domain of Phe-tRNA-synthetase-like protein
MAKPASIQNLLSGKLSAGVNLFLGISACRDEPLAEFIAQQLTAIRTGHSQAMPPGFAWTRKLYNSLRIDPTRHRPSSEALWRRLRGKNDFPAVNPLVDLTNLLSLKFQICFGLYDLAQVHGPIVITLGGEDDRYQGIGKEILNFNGRIVLRDERGAFGNPSADSLRTSVRENSRDIGQVLFFHPGDPRKGEIMAETQATFIRFFTTGAVQTFLLEANNSQGIFPEGEPCKTSASQTRLPTPG